MWRTDRCLCVLQDRLRSLCLFVLAQTLLRFESQRLHLRMAGACKCAHVMSRGAGRLKSWIWTRLFPEAEMGEWPGPSFLGRLESFCLNPFPGLASANLLCLPHDTRPGSQIKEFGVLAFSSSVVTDPDCVSHHARLSECPAVWMRAALPRCKCCEPLTPDDPAWPLRYKKTVFVHSCRSRQPPPNPLVDFLPSTGCLCRADWDTV